MRLLALLLLIAFSAPTDVGYGDQGGEHRRRGL